MTTYVIEALFTGLLGSILWPFVVRWWHWKFDGWRHVPPRRLEWTRNSWRRSANGIAMRVLSGLVSRLRRPYHGLSRIVARCYGKSSDSVHPLLFGATWKDHADPSPTTTTRTTDSS